ncbi:MAG TPA: hypothetical protein VNJ08_00370 [Bacteriovoracaceae bacterium]|nr:hypothetical protein [Bacteriovoracaceae bacterium]
MKFIITCMLLNLVSYTAFGGEVKTDCNSMNESREKIIKVQGKKKQISGSTRQ